MRLRPAIFALLVSAAAPAFAGDYEIWFARKSGSMACYARTYDAGHLAAHPRQKVRAITLDFEASRADSEGNTPLRFLVGLGVMLKDKQGWYASPAFCGESPQGGFQCFLEGDGGRFRLVTSGPVMKIALSGEVAIEGDDFISFGGKASDDNVFILKPAPQKVCDESTAEFR